MKDIETAGKELDAKIVDSKTIIDRLEQVRKIYSVETNL